MDRFSLMSTFARVAEARSFTKAAHSLGVSRATVSLSIQELEEHLGARLLHRTTRSVSLTSEGQLYYEHARELLTKLDAADALFRRRAAHVTGRLVIDAPSRIARRVLVPALPEFLARHPDLELHLGASDRAVDLVATGVDAVIRVGPRKDSGHIVRALGSLRQVTCGSPRYLSRAGHPLQLEDLNQHRFVAYGLPRRGETTFDYVEDGVERTLAVRTSISVDNAETYIAAALAGLGLIQIPAYDVRHHLDSGALVEVLPRHLAPPLPIALVYPSRRQVPARLQVFEAWLEALFAQRGVLPEAAATGRRRGSVVRR